MTKSKHKTAGVIGVLTGFLGLLTFLAGPSLFPKPPIEHQIADKAVEIRDAVVSRLKGESRQSVPLSRRFDRDQLPFTFSLILAGVAVVSGCSAYLRREDKRFAYVACGTGVLTLALNVIAIALGVLVICAILFAISSFFSGAGG